MIDSKLSIIRLYRSRRFVRNRRDSGKNIPQPAETKSFLNIAICICINPGKITKDHKLRVLTSRRIKVKTVTVYIWLGNFQLKKMLVENRGFSAFR